LGKKRADDAPVSILKILDSNGLEDALWCLCAVEGHDREKRLLAVCYARQVQHLMSDPRSLNVLDVSEKFANGEATREELDAALVEAWDAAVAAAWDAAVAAVGDAAVAAVGDAAEFAVGDAAEFAARFAARYAAVAAAGAAAGAAAWGASGDAARASQSAELRRVCQCIEQGIDPYPYNNKGV
jgi:hypothetical protein